MATTRWIIMRHASQTRSGSGPDHTRSLTEVGREEARQLGLRLHELGLEPDRVLSSTATRCRETWEGVSGGLATTPDVEFEDFLYNAGADELLQALTRDAQTGTLLVLAHNPGVSMLSFSLVRGDPESEESLRGGFASASFAVFEMDSIDGTPAHRGARLLRFERPTTSG